MLATGGSAIAALQTLKKWGVPRMKMLAVIASQEGIDNVLACGIDVEIHVSRDRSDPKRSQIHRPRPRRRRRSDF
ncbi:MAG: uracil phosphoribosyltransferase [Pirellulales bacterium]